MVAMHLGKGCSRRPARYSLHHHPHLRFSTGYSLQAFRRLGLHRTAVYVIHPLVRLPVLLGRQHVVPLQRRVRPLLSVFS